MNKWFVWVVMALSFSACTKAQQTTHFSKEALDSKVWAYTDDSETTFGDILKPYEGKKICIDFWASWCKDCIGGMPKVKKYMEEYPDVVFLFVSVDKDPVSWKNRVAGFELPPEQNFIAEGEQKGPLAKFLRMDWIPHYMVVDETGKIVLFRAKDADDSALKEALQ